MPILVSDGEGYEVVPDVVDEPFRGLEGLHSSCWCCMCVREWLRCWYWVRSSNPSDLTSASSSTYTHPLGRSFVGGVEWWLWYFNDIFIVFSNKAGNLSCQHCCFCVRSTNLGHAPG